MLLQKNLFPVDAIVTDRAIEIDEELRGRPPRSEWRRGPWDSEPDIVDWQDEATGLRCLIVRTSLGSLCGYVGVPKSHPWFGLAYSGCINGHAPLTFEERKAKKQKWYDEALAAVEADPSDSNKSMLRISELSLQPFIDDSFADSFFRNHDEWDCTGWNDGPCNTPEQYLNAHGGITFAGMRDSYHEGGLWWFGFDCGHYQDFSPGMDATSRMLDKEGSKSRWFGKEPESYDEATGTMVKYGVPETYRPMAYVKAEVEQLALQLKGVMRKELPSGEVSS